MMQLTPLKDIAEFIRTGKTPPTKDTKYFNGEIQWFTPGDLDKGKFLVKSVRTLTEEAFIDKKAAQFPLGTLLVACIGDIGKLGVTTEECSSNQQITGIKPKSNVDVNYLYYWFRHNKSLIQNTANNAVVPILNNKTLEQIKVLLPPLAEQQKNAAILDAADSLRQKDQQLVERYTALSQSLFLEMFGDPESNSKRLEERLLSEVLDLITYGLTVRPEYVQEGIPLISAREIRSGEVAFESAPKISKSDFERLSDKAKPVKNDILFSKTGSIGHCALVKTKNDFAISQNAARLSFKSLINPMYAMSYLKTPYFQRLSQNRAKGNAVKDLQLGDMKMFKFLLPSSILQNQFAERIQLIEAQKQQAQRSLEKSEALFSSLLQRAFMGELTPKMAA